MGDQVRSRPQFGVDGAGQGGGYGARGLCARCVAESVFNVSELLENVHEVDIEILRVAVLVMVLVMVMAMVKVMVMVKGCSKGYGDGNRHRDTHCSGWQWHDGDGETGGCEVVEEGCTCLLLIGAHIQTAEKFDLKKGSTKRFPAVLTSPTSSKSDAAV